MGNPQESVDELVNKDENPNENMHQVNEDQTENEYAGSSILDIADEIIKLDIPGSDGFASGKQLYKCDECEATYKSR